MIIEFNLKENDSFNPINIASAMIDNISKSPTMSEEEQVIFLKEISEHLKVYCDNKIVC